MSSPNSSGSRERFTLAATEEKVFENVKTGLSAAPFGGSGNRVTLEVNGDHQPFTDMNGGVAAVPGNAVVTLETSEDGTTFTVVKTLTVVYRGQSSDVGNVGKFFKVKNAGPAIAHVVFNAINQTQLQPKVSL